MLTCVNATSWICVIDNDQQMRAFYTATDCVLCALLLLYCSSITTYSSSSSGESSSSIRSLQRMVYDCAVSADREVQYNLINNVVLCGGGSSYDNIVERLRYEVKLTSC
jgi:hypothetical protein